ncbi:hypothetical protein [Cohnella mopanensis]|uniref:hypothetical protein n=1 Tax=Cohnella mopanensis TaxID=2911966 RepID=UPI001EF8C16E|nr:hypothetical protein [Cohnella mopanensis]
MKKGSIAILVVGTVLIAFNVYQYFTAQQNKNAYADNETRLMNVINQTTETLLKEDVYITDAERLQLKEWNIMFDGYGVPDSVGNVELLRIPTDNKEVLKLFPENSNPVLMEASDTDIEIRYNTGNKTYGLIFNKLNNTLIKTIYLPLSEPEYLVGYRNINNREYSSVFVDLNPHN